MNALVTAIVITFSLLVVLPQLVMMFPTLATIVGIGCAVVGIYLLVILFTTKGVFTNDPPRTKYK